MKKKVIRLTESDVERLVKRIIKEDFTRREDMFKTKDLSKPKSEQGPLKQIMIDCEPYEESRFGQSKYGVYIETDRKHYYIGDLRKLGDNYTSYLDIERYIETEPHGVLCHPDESQMALINKELNKVRKGVARKFESLINYERDMYM